MVLALQLEVAKFTSWHLLLADSSAAEQVDSPHFSFPLRESDIPATAEQCLWKGRRIVLPRVTESHHLELPSHYTKCGNIKMFSAQFQWSVIWFQWPVLCFFCLVWPTCILLANG